MAVNVTSFRCAIEHVCDVFKIPSLFPEQEKCLEALFEGKDVYASLPTGYGKSLIFYAVPIVADELFSRPRGSSKIIVFLRNQLSLNPLFKKLADAQASSWKLIFLHYLKPVGGKLFLACDFDVKNFP